MKKAGYRRKFVRTLNLYLRDEYLYILIRKKDNRMIKRRSVYYGITGLLTMAK